MPPRRSFNLPVIIAVVLGLGFGASAFLNMAQYSRSEQEKKLLRGEITDLKYQVDQDRLAAGSSPTPAPTGTPEPSDSPSPSPTAAPDTAPDPPATPAVAGASTRTIKPCNLHPSAGNTRPYLIPYQSMSNPQPATIGEASGGYTQVTVAGKTGFVLTSCVNS